MFHIKTQELLRVVPEDSVQEIIDTKMSATVLQIDHYKRLDVDVVETLATYFEIEVVGCQGALIWSKSNPSGYHYYVVAGQVCIATGEKGGSTKRNPISTRHALIGPLEYFGPWAVKDDELDEHGLEWKFISHSRKVTLIKMKSSVVDKVLGANLLATVQEAALTKYKRWIESFRELQKGKEAREGAEEQPQGNVRNQTAARTKPNQAGCQRSRSPSRSRQDDPLKTAKIVGKTSSTTRVSSDAVGSSTSGGASVSRKWGAYSAHNGAAKLISIPGLPKKDLNDVISHTMSLPDLRNRKYKQESPLKLKWSSGLDAITGPYAAATPSSTGFVRGSFIGGFIGQI
jgi:hypothetical protein